jgi:hypothetical protein
VEFSEPQVIPVFNAVFLDCSALATSQILPAALHFWELVQRFPSMLSDLVPCKSFFPVFRSLFSCDGESAAAMASALAAAAAPQLESQPQLRSAFVDFFMTHEIAFHFASLSPLLPPLFALYSIHCRNNSFGPSDSCIRVLPNHLNLNCKRWNFFVNHAQLW